MVLMSLGLLRSNAENMIDERDDVVPQAVSGGVSEDLQS